MPYPPQPPSAFGICKKCGNSLRDEPVYFYQSFRVSSFCKVCDYCRWAITQEHLTRVQCDLRDTLSREHDLIEKVVKLERQLGEERSLNQTFNGYIGANGPNGFITRIKALEDWVATQKESNTKRKSWG